ncbi:MAG: hypothetical protein OEY40_04225 [Candidatus Bathyarchaeota archaeon]|nr:hypothetical protein [Candidatus Bathyarchaeota archaeon]
MKIEWPKSQFWIVGAVILFVLRMVIVGPQYEYAWLNFSFSLGASFMLGWFVGYLLQIAIITLIISWVWNAYKSSKK